MKAKGSSGTYRHFIPKLDLAIERYTSHVPNDGKFYIVQKSKIVGGFSSLKKAEEMFKQLANEMGHKPKVSTSAPPNAADIIADKYFYEKAIFWATKDKHRSKGGRFSRHSR